MEHSVRVLNQIAEQYLKGDTAPIRAMRFFKPNRKIIRREVRLVWPPSRAAGENGWGRFGSSPAPQKEGFAPSSVFNAAAAAAAAAERARRLFADCQIGGQRRITLMCIHSGENGERAFSTNGKLHRRTGVIYPWAWE